MFIIFFLKIGWERKLDHGSEAASEDSKPKSRAAALLERVNCFFRVEILPIYHRPLEIDSCEGKKE